MRSRAEVGQILLALLLWQICTSVSAGDVPQPNDGGSFDYTDGPRGPSRWGDLKPEWSSCSQGLRQSPMLITFDDVVADPRLGKLDATYTSKRVPCNVSYDGHEVELSVPASAGKLKIDNVVYRPAQMHFHMPSEHKILNHSFPLELHMVHVSKGGKIAVIAWLFNLGDDSPFLAQIMDKLPSSKVRNVHTQIAPIKLPMLQRSYGRYQGSLTTPPCLETVTWTVMLWNVWQSVLCNYETVAGSVSFVFHAQLSLTEDGALWIMTQFPTISTNQLKEMKAAMPHENARPSHPCHGREFRINTGQ